MMDRVSPLPYFFIRYHVTPRPKPSMLPINIKCQTQRFPPQIFSSSVSCLSTRSCYPSRMLEGEEAPFFTSRNEPACFCSNHLTTSPPHGYQPSSGRLHLSPGSSNTIAIVISTDHFNPSEQGKQAPCNRGIPLYSTHVL